MTTSDPERVKELFLAAIDLPAADIDAYVQSACGNDEALRDEVLSLLAHHHDAELIADSHSEVASAPTRLLRGRGSQRVASAPTRYREISELGSGGCGRVARVYDRQLGRVVALKQVREEEDSLRRMLVREAQMLAYLDHPGAVQVFDCSTDEPNPFYTMRILEGETLHEYLRRARSSGTPILVGEAIRIVSRICETMANAHAKGLMHLDLKPANIVLQPFGQVCVIDWGLARFYDRGVYETYVRESGGNSLPDIGESDTVGGTPGYMPPEQLSGQALGPAADIYACGTILYELLTGRLPFDVRAFPLAIAQQKAGAPRSVTEQRADVPALLSDLCLRLLRGNPADRPSSFLEVLGELQALSHRTSASDTIELAAGDILFSEGDPGNIAYQILSGTLSVSVRTPEGTNELARRTVGDLIGELSIVSNAPRSATVTALEPTRVAVITAAVIDRELDTASPLLARMLRSLSDRLREEATRR